MRSGKKSTEKADSTHPLCRSSPFDTRSPLLWNYEGNSIWGSSPTSIKQTNKNKTINASLYSISNLTPWKTETNMIQFSAVIPGGWSEPSLLSSAQTDTFLYFLLTVKFFFFTSSSSSKSKPAHTVRNNLSVNKAHICLYSKPTYTQTHKKRCSVLTVQQIMFNNCHIKLFSLLSQMLLSEDNTVRNIVHLYVVCWD